MIMRAKMAELLARSKAWFSKTEKDWQAFRGVGVVFAFRNSKSFGQKFDKIFTGADRSAFGKDADGIRDSLVRFVNPFRWMQFFLLLVGVTSVFLTGVVLDSLNFFRLDILDKIRSINIMLNK